MTTSSPIPTLARALALSMAWPLLAVQPALAQHGHAPATKAGGDVCALGTEQSPIHIRSAAAARAPLPALAFEYHSSNVAVENHGHAVQATLKAVNRLTIGGAEFKLLQFHYHHPAEHVIDGRAAPLEVHLVHQDAHGRLAVVGVLFEEGAANPALAVKLASIGSEATLDPQALLPGDLGYYTYDGSLTTPPCSEGVRWLVLAQPMTASAEQIAVMKQHVEPNARAVQKVNERRIERSIH